MGCCGSKQSRSSSEDALLAAREADARVAPKGTTSGPRIAARGEMMELVGSDCGSNVRLSDLLGYRQECTNSASKWAGTVTNVDKFDIPFLRTEYEAANGTTRSQPMGVPVAESGWTSTRSAPPVSRVGRTSQVLRDVRPLDNIFTTPKAMPAIWAQGIDDYNGRHAVAIIPFVPKIMIADMISVRTRNLRNFSD